MAKSPPANRRQIKGPTSFYAGSFLFASTLAGVDAMAAADKFFPEIPELRVLGAIVMIAGFLFLAVEIFVGQ